MSAAPDMKKEAALDQCIDRLMAGERWETGLPASEAERAEVAELMAVAEKLLVLARQTVAPEATRRQRIRRRLEGPRSIIRQIAFYRLPYLPPLWIKPEAC